MFSIAIISQSVFNFYICPRTLYFILYMCYLIKPSLALKQVKKCYVLFIFTLLDIFYLYQSFGCLFFSFYIKYLFSVQWKNYDELNENWHVLHRSPAKYMPIFIQCSISMAINIFMILITMAFIHVNIYITTMLLCNCYHRYIMERKMILLIISLFKVSKKDLS